MVTKDSIENQSDKNLVATLESLGYLPNHFQGGFLFNLLEHQNPKIRLLVLCNLSFCNDIFVMTI